MNSNMQGIIQGSFPLTGQRPAHGAVSKIDPAVIGTPAFGGRPLPVALQARMAALFRQNFSDVRIHVGPQAPNIGAVAFAMGSNLYFAPGRFQPESPDGQRLIAHELTHVVQQRSGRVPRPAGGGLFIVHNPSLEAEAERMGRLAATPQAQARTSPTGPPAALQRKPSNVIQRWPPDEPGSLPPVNPNLLNMDLWPSLSLDTPVVRLWTPPQQTPPPPVFSQPLPQPVRIFDISRRGISHIPITPLPGTILVPPEKPLTSEQRQAIRDEIDEDLEKSWRASEEKEVRARYNDVHIELVNFKYFCLSLVGNDLTTHQFDILDGLLHLISTEPIARGRILLGSPKARKDIEYMLPACLAWIEIVAPAVKALAQCRPLIADVDEIMEQLTGTYETRTNLYKRQDLGRQLDPKVSEWAKLTLICPLFWKTAKECDNQPLSLKNLKKIAIPVLNLFPKLQIFQKQIYVLGGIFEEAVERTPALKAPAKKLTVAEQNVVDAWNKAYGAKHSPFLDVQIQKILAAGDFEMLRQLTAIVLHIQANGGTRYNGVDINPHPLVGNLSGAVSYDFPFLNKTRLGYGNRGIWRIIFQGTRIYGIYDDHNGQIDKWKGEGLTKSAA